MVVAFVGLLIGLGPLNDNSYLTHLATGRLIWSSHHVPLHDPYSFTAPGHPWVVQSWLASLLYGAADQLWGPAGVLLLVAFTTTVLAALVWTLTRPAGSLIGRVLLIGPLLLVGTDAGWVERPLLFGLVVLALVLLAAEDRLDPRWLVPAMWIWVNVHGSFPLGLLAVALVAVGRHLDGESAAVEWRSLKWAVGGTLLGALNPIGPRLLVFPVELLSRQDVLSNVREWQAPTFTRFGQRAFLALVAVALVALVRKPSWRAGLPLIVFLVAALVGSRNIVFASTVLLPGAARGLTGLGSVAGDERRSVNRALVGVIAVVAVIATVSAARGSVYSFEGYPVAAVTFAERHGLLAGGEHLVARDYVGNYLEARFGPSVKVFFDDRFDMFPARVADDDVTLVKGEPGWDRVLATYRATAVLWRVDEPLGQLVAASPLWHVVYADSEYLVAEPR